MRICLYTATALPKLGGQELVVDALARELTKLGHDITVLCPRARRPLVERDADLPYRVVRHPRFLSTRWGVSLYARYVRKASAAHGPFDVIHCHETYPTGFVAVRAAVAPVVITSHGGDLNAGNVRIVKPGIEARCREALQRASALVSISRFTESNFHRVAAGRPIAPIAHIPNGVYLDELISAPECRPAGVEDKPFILYLGRLHRRKGVDTLIEAMRTLPHVHLLLAGEGPERADLEQLAAGLNNVQFLGRREGDEKGWLLRHARAVVIPSRDWEAFPLVVLEAAAAGRPVIASDIAGLQDLIQPGSTGLLVPEGNSAALGKGIDALWRDPLQAERMGAEAKRWVLRYDWPSVAGEYEKLYRAQRGTGGSPALQKTVPTG